MAKKTKEKKSKAEELELEIINLDVEEAPVEVETEAEAEVATEVETEAEAEVATEVETEVEAEVVTEVETEAEAETVSEVTEEPEKPVFSVESFLKDLKARLAGNKKQVGIIAAVVALVIIIAGIVGFNIYERSVVYKVCRVEAGIEVTVADFLKKADENAVFAKGSDKIDISVPGTYRLKVKTGAFTHTCTLHIEDTTAPEVEVNSVSLGYGDTCKADAFIKQITDATATKVAFVKEPDFKKFDEQKVEIVVTDAADNATTVEAQLVIMPVVPSISIEIGEEWPEISDFVLVDAEAKFVTTEEDVEIDQLVPGTYQFIIEIEGRQYTVEVVTVDTVAPVLEVKDVNGFAHAVLDAGKFVASCEDLTKVTYSYETAPDFTKLGEQEVVVVATDESGNQTKQTAKLTLVEDTVAPVITGVKDLLVYVGDTVSYRSGVKVTDNSGVEIELKVDSSAVDVKKAGTYTIVYSATDGAGNTTSVTTSINVRERAYTLEEVNFLADRALATIINNGMNNYQKAQAIFNYIQRSISYINYSAKGDYVRAAYEGLAMGKGDCYVFACVSKVMLTRAGITNMDIERIRVGDTMHFWNLVDIGDGHGWYHFDATPRKDKTRFFLWDDASIKAYSDSHNNSHNYDRNLYPYVP